MQESWHGRKEVLLQWKQCAGPGLNDTWQLSNQLLRRDEVWFTEKDEQGISKLYSLADFVDESGARIRKDESYEKNYLIGKYGAIPTLKSIDIFKEE